MTKYYVKWEQDKLPKRRVYYRHTIKNNVSPPHAIYIYIYLIYTYTYTHIVQRGNAVQHLPSLRFLYLLYTFGRVSSTVDRAIIKTVPTMGDTCLARKELQTP